MKCTIKNIFIPIVVFLFSVSSVSAAIQNESQSVPSASQLNSSEVLVYQNPITHKIYSFTDRTAFDILKKQSNVISSSSSKFLTSAISAERKKYVGRFFLIKGENNKLWYVQPVTLKVYYLDRSQKSFIIISSLLKSTVCDAIVREKKLSMVVECKVDGIKIDGKLAQLIRLSYASDAQMAVEYRKNHTYGGVVPEKYQIRYYVGILSGDKSMDLGGANTFPMFYTDQFRQEFGQWCSYLSDHVVVDPKVIKTIKVVRGESVLMLHFAQYDNLKEIKELIAKDPVYKASNDPKYCILNGDIPLIDKTLMYTRYDARGNPLPNTYRKSDFSEIHFQLKPLLGFRSKTIQELIAGCRDWPSSLPQAKQDMRRRQCFNKIAVEENDIVICKNLSNTVDSDMCIGNFAVEEKNETICDYFTDISSRDVCFRDVAVKKGDVHICRKINDYFMMEACAANFGKRF